MLTSNYGERHRPAQRSMKCHTVAVAWKAGLVTLARKGMAGEGNREIQLGGEGNREKCRSNMKTRPEKEWRGGRLIRTIRCFSALPSTSGVFFGLDFLSFRGPELALLSASAMLSALPFHVPSPLNIDGENIIL